MYARKHGCNSVYSVVTTFAYLSSVLYGASAFILEDLGRAEPFLWGLKHVNFSKMTYILSGLVKVWCRKPTPSACKFGTVAALPYVIFTQMFLKVFVPLLRVQCTVHKESDRIAESETNFNLSGLKNKYWETWRRLFCYFNIYSASPFCTQYDHNPLGRICDGIFKQSMRARNRVGIGLSYRPTRLQRLAELIPWNRFFGSLKV